MHRLKSSVHFIIMEEILIKTAASAIFYVRSRFNSEKSLLSFSLSFAHFRHDSGDAGVKGHLLVFWGDFAGGIEIIMNRFHGVHDFLALLGVVLLPMKLLEIGLISILGIKQLIVQRIRCYFRSFFVPLLGCIFL